MRVQTLVAIAVAALLLVGGAVMVGAASPADQANETAADASQEHAPDDAGPGEQAGPPADIGASDEQSADAADPGINEESNSNETSIGPSDGLPEPVPDHVITIHDTIESFLNDVIDHLGEALSDFLSDGDGSDSGNGNETSGDAVGSGQTGA